MKILNKIKETPKIMMRYVKMLKPTDYLKLQALIGGSTPAIVTDVAWKKLKILNPVGTQLREYYELRQYKDNLPLITLGGLPVCDQPQGLSLCMGAMHKEYMVTKSEVYYMKTATNCLPERLRAISPEHAEYFILVLNGAEDTGMYSNGSTATRRLTFVYLLKRKPNGELYTKHKDVVLGSAPPSIIGAHQRGSSGGKPDLERVIQAVMSDIRRVDRKTKSRCF